LNLSGARRHPCTWEVSESELVSEDDSPPGGGSASDYLRK
jgi:hypothetical protein